jgi:hypothetical protein
MKFPMGHAIFEQDTNRLARNAPKDHAIEIPESLVPPQEKMIKGGKCPKKPVYALKYYDLFDEAYVRKFAQGETGKLVCDDSVIGNTQCKSGTKDLKVKDKKDESCQFFLKNDHPLTVYKFINRERFVPIAKPFADPLYQEHWHEPDNPWSAQYPYNVVWEGYHEEGSTQINNPGNEFVSEAYGYNKTIESYDGSAKEGIYRKQKCGIGSWGLGEEWDSTPGNQRYHRFHPAGNYYEIDKKGNEVKKIYGDNFEIDVKNKNIYIKGDWNITVLGDKNELIMGDYNLQVEGDINTDARKDINIHTYQNHNLHVREDLTERVDGDKTETIKGDRNTTVMQKDYIESVDAERRADTIIRKGAKSMEDEAFMDYTMKAHHSVENICIKESNIDTWNTVVTTETNDIKTLTEKIEIHTKDVKLFDETIEAHDEKKVTYDESIEAYTGCIRDYTLNTENYILYYQDIFLEEQKAFTCLDGIGTPQPEEPKEVELGTASYPETDGIQKCIRKYNECIEAALSACSTTLVDPRTMKDYTRIDWEKYHASIKSCKESYEQCVNSNIGKECDICSPEQGTDEWVCTPCHDPNCPEKDKEWIFYQCPDKCKGTEEVPEKKVDPWKNCEQEDV